MPAKKAATKQPESSDMGNVWKWVFIIGALVSGVAKAIAFPSGPAGDILTWILILAGILVGLFWRDTDDLKGFGIRYLLLAAVAGSLNLVPAVGPILTGFFQGFVVFLGPVALATLFMYFWKKYFSGMM